MGEYYQVIYVFFLNFLVKHSIYMPHTFLVLIFSYQLLYLGNCLFTQPFPFLRMIKIHDILSKIEKVFIYTGEIMFYVFYFLLPNKHIASVPTTASPSPLTKYSCLDYVIIRKKAPTHSLMKLCIWSITHLQKCGTVVILMKICAHFFLLVHQIYFFCQITTFIKVRMTFVFGLQTL